MSGHILRRSRNDLNSETAGREVADDWRDRKMNLSKNRKGIEIVILQKFLVFIQYRQFL